jgi:hypothetical protein
MIPFSYYCIKYLSDIDGMYVSLNFVRLYYLRKTFFLFKLLEEVIYFKLSLTISKVYNILIYLGWKDFVYFKTNIWKRNGTGK